MSVFTIRLARKRGFCSGVRRALAMVDATLASGVRPVWLLHEIVHNTAIVAELTRRGCRIVDGIDDIPPGGTVIFSAHGVAGAVETAARARGLAVVDATCPLVKRIHEKTKLADSGALVILIGHRGHPETVGTLGQRPGRIHLVETSADVAGLPAALPGQTVQILSQTTLSEAELAAPLAALRERYSVLAGTGDLCYATTDRQQAVRELAQDCGLIVVIGSKTSSNSNRLCDVARQCGRRALLIDSPDELDAAMLEGVDAVGVSAGASAPEYLVDAVCAWLREHGGVMY